MAWLDTILFVDTPSIQQHNQIDFYCKSKCIITHRYSDCFFDLCSDYGKHLEDALSTVEPKVNVDHGVKY